ncbi:hypothetical protein PIROE2DRAFT_57047 [Piromyces sp. E2]|nr:hypothetical protein PIROE2DRAFT_57047 [Piromyces sp. E2]|eukprot:OUM69965.1 hypothetical protein PIROE2DRAFT_57047 [Piromyces sp. E2]
MNFKTIFAILGLSTIALGKKSSVSIKVDSGIVPKEIVDLFDYKVGDEMAVGLLRKSCIVENYEKYCSDNYTSSKIDKSKLKIMKKEIDMGNQTQEQVCKTINEACHLISTYYNPLTGEALSKAHLEINDKEVPSKIVNSLVYHVGGKEDDMVVNGVSRSLYYEYVDNCGEDMKSIDKNLESKAEDEYPGYSQEDICDIIKIAYKMVNYNYNPVTGEAVKVKELITREGEVVPKEYESLFDYEVGDEFGTYLNRKACNVEYYYRYCNDDDTSDEIDKSKLKIMKKEIDMGGKSQEEICQVIKGTCDLINYHYNPLTGKSIPFSKLYTDEGKVPVELMYLFKYSVNNDKEVNANKNECLKIYKNSCGNKSGKVDKSKLKYMENFFESDSRSQKELCKVIKSTCEMINNKYNPLYGEGRKLLVEVN